MSTKDAWFCASLKPIKRKDLLEKGKKGYNAFETGAKIHFREKNILVLRALYSGFSLNTIVQLGLSSAKDCVNIVYNVVFLCSHKSLEKSRCN